MWRPFKRRHPTTVQEAPLDIVKRPSADTLRPYIGEWVALDKEQVIYHATSVREVVMWLGRNGIKGAVLLFVPQNPEENLMGAAVEM